MAFRTGRREGTCLHADELTLSAVCLLSSMCPGVWLSLQFLVVVTLGVPQALNSSSDYCVQGVGEFASVYWNPQRESVSCSIPSCNSLFFLLRAC